MNFWELRDPPGSDYSQAHINGKLDHPYRLPSAVCEDCGETVSSLDAVVPYECPPRFREVAELTHPDAKIPMKQFRTLERQLAAELRKAGVKKPLLPPGACLQPGFLDIPSIPKADFLWSSLWSGLSSIVVSDRVRTVLLEAGAGAVAFWPVTFRKVGRRPANASPRIPKSGEPEDMKMPRRSAPTVGLGAYHQLFVLAQSGYPPGTEPGPACPTCGQCLERDWKAEVSMARKRDLVRQETWRNLSATMLESIWDGSPIFRLAGRATLLVTEELKQRLEGLNVTRVEFRPYPRPQPRPRRRAGGLGA